MAGNANNVATPTPAGGTPGHAANDYMKYFEQYQQLVAKDLLEKPGLSLSDENLQLSFDEYINKVKNEAEKYALILGYNYKSSKWYEASYRIINKDYKIKKISDKKEKENLLKKFKNLFK